MDTAVSSPNNKETEQHGVRCMEIRDWTDPDTEETDTGVAWQLIGVEGEHKGTGEGGEAFLQEGKVEQTWPSSSWLGVSWC